MPCRVSLVVALVACAAVVALCAAPSLAAVPSAPTSALSSTSAAEYQSTAEPLERAADVSSPFLPLFPLDSLVVTRLWSALQSLSSGASSSASSVLLPHPAVPVASHPLSSLRPAASTVHSLDYTIPASAPPYLPAARLTCALQVVDGGSHRSVLLQLGSPAQSLRLLVDTGSSDLVALNASYCIRSPSASRNCFNPSAPASPQSATVVSSAPFALPAYVDDGEVLSDSSAHAALALANLPVQLLGANLSLLLGAADLTMQDALLGYPTAASRQVSFVLSNPQTVFVPPIPAVNFPYSVSAVNSLLDVDGLLGLSYASLSALAQLDANTYSSAFLAITQATQTQAESTTFALDFSKNIAYIGGIDESYRSSLQWGYGAAVGLDDYHSFSMWDFSVCGANLQQGVLQGVAPLSAIVDTGSSCLSLPAELFDALVSWLPVTCSDATDGTQQGQSTATAVDPSLLGGNVGDPSSPGSSSTYTADPGSASNINTHVRYCWLAADLLSGTLPTVSFRMAQSNPLLADDHPLQPPKLYIPLADLIIGTPRTTATSAVEPQRLCLYRTGSLFAAGASLPTISLGSRTMLSLHSVFSMDSHQVAFSNTAGVSGSNATCVSAVRCVGQQTLDSTYNVCVDPSCSSYYFFSLNGSSHRCELTSGFHVLAALLIAALVLSELGLNEWLISISKRVQGINADDKHSHSAQQARRRRRVNAAR